MNSASVMLRTRSNAPPVAMITPSCTLARMSVTPSEAFSFGGQIIQLHGRNTRNEPSAKQSFPSASTATNAHFRGTSSRVSDQCQLTLHDTVPQGRIHPSGDMSSPTYQSRKSLALSTPAPRDREDRASSRRSLSPGGVHRHHADRDEPSHHPLLQPARHRRAVDQGRKARDGLAPPLRSPLPGQ